MAEKKQSSAEAYKNIMAELQAGKVAPVYLLMGEESYYIDKVCEYITNNVLKEEEKDFNLTVLYGSDVSARQVMDQARRFPMMAERQVVVVKEAQSMKDLEEMEQYMDKPIASTVLVVCYKGGTIDGRKKITAKAQSIGRVLVSDPLRYDRDIIAFLTSYIKQPGYEATIDPRAAQVVAAHIGGDLKRLTSELDKVMISFPPGAKRVITSDIIEQKIGISKQYNVFELRDALINKDAVKAHRIAKYFDDNPKSGGLFAMIPQVFSFYQNLMLAYYAPRPITESAIMSQLGLKSPYATRDYITAMRNFPARKTIEIISKIREIDARSKGLDNVNTTPGDLMKELVSFILN
ncbi:MAG: DNA polymerase III subunit delta [Prevotella sp.]|nr:DNA polymerase III subunit delta [Candidatus Prevotella equi]